jgi:glycosyltransferase involved in cell wall biosynthesis
MMASMAGLPKNSVVFSPGYNGPLSMIRPFVFTLHDLNHIDVPANGSILKRLYYRLVIKRACQAASRVLTVSEFSRNRIADWSGVAADKIVNIGNGVDPLYQPKGPCYQAGHPYLLVVGSSRKPHKNDVRLIEAFSRAGIDTSVKLLLTGAPTKELEDVAKRCGVDSRIRFLGCVKTEELPPLYRGALALLFPSLYEGFGLPIVEAMACGTPVLTSACTGTEEVAADAAVTIDPYSTEKIAEGIKKITEDSDLRVELKLKGLERAAIFNWDKVADRIRLVLEETIAESGAK